MCAVIAASVLSYTHGLGKIALYRNSTSLTDLFLMLTTCKTEKKIMHAHNYSTIYLRRLHEILDCMENQNSHELGIK